MIEIAYKLRDLWIFKHSNSTGNNHLHKALIDINGRLECLNVTGHSGKHLPVMERKTLVIFSKSIHSTQCMGPDRLDTLHIQVHLIVSCVTSTWHVLLTYFFYFYTETSHMIMTPDPSSKQCLGKTWGSCYIKVIRIRRCHNLKKAFPNVCNNNRGYPSWGARPLSPAH